MKRAIRQTAAALTFALWIHGADTAATRFESALYKEQVEGDLNGAIQLYKQVSAGKDANRSLAARALLQAARCYEKLGNSEARAVYERITTGYGDQQDTAAQARKALARLAPAKVGSDELTTRRIASLPTMPPIASDGRYAYYARWNEEEGSGLWLERTGPFKGGTIVRRNLLTGEERNLHTHRVLPIGMALSPDGARLAVEFATKSQGESEIVLLKTDGSGIARVFPKTSRTHGITEWSPNGRELLVSGTSAERLLLLDVNTGEIRTLKSFESRAARQNTVWGAAFSTDGEWIVYDRLNQEGDRRRIEIISRDGTTVRTLVDGPGNSIPVGWIPGRPELLFVSDRTGTIDAFAIEVQGGKAAGEPRLVKENFGVAHHVGLSGQAFVYRHRQKAQRIVWGTLDERTGEIRDKKPASSRYVAPLLRPLVSPDGKQLAYATEQLMLEGRPSLVVRDLESGRERLIDLLPHLALVAANGSWADDGRAVYISGMKPDGAKSSVRVDLETGAVSAISSKVCYQPFPDGVHVVCEDDVGKRVRLSKLNWRTGKETELTDISGKAYYPLSPDGTHIAYPDSSGQSVVLRDLDTGAERKLLENANAAETVVKGWITADQVLVWQGNRSGPVGGWWLVPIGTGEPRPGTELYERVRATSWPKIATVELPANIEVWLLENAAAASRPTSGKEAAR